MKGGFRLLSLALRGMISMEIPCTWVHRLTSFFLINRYVPYFSKALSPNWENVGERSKEGGKPRCSPLSVSLKSETEYDLPKGSYGIVQRWDREKWNFDYALSSVNMLKPLCNHNFHQEGGAFRQFRGSRVGLFNYLLAGDSRPPRLSGSRWRAGLPPPHSLRQAQGCGFPH